MPAWTWATLGVADIDAALLTWQGRMGFQLSQAFTGPDPGLEAYWKLPPGSIYRQVMLRAPGCRAGQLHLVQFSKVGPAVREDASAFDLCPKNLDIYVDDMSRRMSDLRAAGMRFRNPDFTEAVSPDGVRFREIHLAGHDEINFVLLQLLDHPPPVDANGFSGIGPLVTIVRDTAAERDFYRDVLGLTLLHDNVLEGPEIERMIGLPPGAALDVSIWGQPGEHLGQVEIIAYRGTRGADLYPRAQPGARGIFELNWALDSTDALIHRLEAARIPFERQSIKGRLVSSSGSIFFRSPAGMRVSVHSA